MNLSVDLRYFCCDVHMNDRVLLGKWMTLGRVGNGSFISYLFLNWILLIYIMPIRFGVYGSASATNALVKRMSFVFPELSYYYLICTFLKLSPLILFNFTYMKITRIRCST